MLTEQQQSLRSDVLIALLHPGTASCHQMAGPEHTSTIRHLHASGNPSACFMLLVDGKTSMRVAVGARLVATDSCMQHGTHGAGSGPPTIAARRMAANRLPRRATQPLSVTGVVCAHRRSRDEAGLHGGRWGPAHLAC